MTGTATSAQIDQVLFDLGGVLIDWDPRYLYRQVFSDEADMERFLGEVCTPAWNHALDAGRPMAEAMDELHARFPADSAAINLWRDRWPEMMRSAITGTEQILDELVAAGVPVYALTNWSADTFHHARARFSFLDHFKDILVSGVEKIAKPDPEIYRMVLGRNGLAAERTIFIDDVPRNVESARSVGLHAVQFYSPERLRSDLAAYGLLSGASA